MNVELMPDLSEIVHYEYAGMPLYIRTTDLSIYPDMSAPCHWHDDIEWIHVISGKMRYYINGKRIVLNTNDSLMVNARQMHYGYSFEKQDCRFACVLFHPSLFCNNRVLLQKYITPVLENSNLEYLYFDSSRDDGEKVGGFIGEVIRLKEQAAEAYELEVIGVMHSLWSWLLNENESMLGDVNRNASDELVIPKNMVSFIYQHYDEKVSLDEIAAAGNVSRSRCCMIFKRYLQQSPIDFLNTYRLKVSCEQLRSTEKSITEIAFSCGFNHLSYFSKMFVDCYGCTPREYRSREYQSRGVREG